MADVDPRLRSAVEAQLSAWRAALEGGAERVGWKLGTGDRERIGPGPVVGHLTSATQLVPGGVFDAAGASALHADAEVALTLARDVPPGDAADDAIARYGVALELVDLGGSDDPEQIVASNVFHRAFALGSLDRPPPVPASVTARLLVNGDVRGEAAAAHDQAELVQAVAEVLGAVGERLRAGDRLITGSVVQVPVQPGDEVVADMRGLGRVRVMVR